MTTTSTEKAMTGTKETKLRLNRCTLRNLTANDLRQVVGGTTQASQKGGYR